MRIGVPTEVKRGERRVAMTPAGVRELVQRGHQVLVQSGAGLGSGLDDSAFAAQGAVIVSVGELFERAELILKVKEPQPPEVERLRPGHLLFSYLHLAANPELAHGLCESGATCMAYETVELADRTLPLLAPMSEIAGRVATQVGTTMLMAPAGGSGTLLGGVPGVDRGRVVIIGGGVAGANAAKVAAGLGAETVVLDRSVQRLRELDVEFGWRIQTLKADSLAIERALRDADLVLGAVLRRGARAPHVLSEEMTAAMRPGSVLVDISIDQGGCFETSRPTTHDEPTFTFNGVVHYCVTNVPAAVPVSSTSALTNATLPYILRLAETQSSALEHDPELRSGVNIADGEIVHPVVAAELGATRGAGRLAAASA